MNVNIAILRDFCRDSRLAAPAVDRLEAQIASLATHRTELLNAGHRISDLEIALASTRQALAEIEEQQPKTIDWLRANGIIFDGPLGTDPDNWEHVAFSIYSDLCETGAIARRALAATEGET